MTLDTIASKLAIPLHLRQNVWQLMTQGKNHYFTIHSAETARTKIRNMYFKENRIPAALIARKHGRHSDFQEMQKEV
jgi:hypothetical protein